MDLFYRLCLVFSVVLAWCVTGVVEASTGPVVSYDRITVSLPVYVTSVIMTAISTWVVAKYDNKRCRKMLEMETKLDAVNKFIREIEEEKKKKQRVG